VKKDTSKNKLIVLGVMMLTLAAVGFWQFSRGTGSVQPPASSTAVATTETAAPAAAPAPADGAPAVVQSQFKEVDVDLDKLVQEIKEVDFAYLPEGRNPMTPLVGRTYFATNGAEDGTGAGLGAFELMAIAQRMSLTGLIWDEKDPVAVIDNVVVRPGYEFPEIDIRVREIQPTSVTLEVEDSLVELTLEER
jgi:hypothetical protein